mmetsp:Transcript_4819/g.7713  ORF Transcript_4819/g.7713 Transcript_4819/m.7713 type:complete len:661 (+) Transcript_4819:51-2033(+)
MYAHHAPNQHEMAQLQFQQMQQQMAQGGFMAGFGGQGGMFPHQGQAPQTGPNASPAQAKGSKKRKADGAGSWESAVKPERNHSPPPAELDGDEDGKGKASGFLRLPDVIDKLAKSAEVLQYDPSSQLYCVLDGPGFEKQFNELRYTRGKKNDATTNRPFSRMHAYFVLVRGEKWAGTGSAFKAKEVSQMVSPADRVSASNINITLMPSDESASFQVTLQHFLNVTGAGDLYKFARGAGAKEGQKNCMDSDGTSTPGHSNSRAPSVPSSSQGPCSPASAEEFFENCDSDTLLDANDVGNLLETIWNENSKGDQAYFFRREDGLRPFANGAICTLVDGVLTADAKPSPGAMYMVVSDNNAKWKGEPIPTPEEEYYGHWCCFLGQLPVVVEGTVRCGDYIGPKGDGTGVGIVAQMGKWPVVGIALANKSSDEPGIVKTMVFAGLNAMTRGGDDFTEIFEQARQTQAMVEGVKRDVANVEKSVEQIKGRSGMTETNVLNLAARLHMVERSVFNPVMRHPATVPSNDGEWRMLSPGQSLDRNWSQQCSRWVKKNKTLAMGILLVCCVVGTMAHLRHEHHRHEERDHLAQLAAAERVEEKDRVPWQPPVPPVPPAHPIVDRPGGGGRRLMSAAAEIVGFERERDLMSETEALIRLQAGNRANMLSR